MPIIKDDARSRKEERRSPIKDKPLRTPGQSLSETVEDQRLDRFSALSTVVIFSSFTVFEWIRWAFRVQPTLKSCLVITAATLSGSVFAFRDIRKSKAKSKNFELGLEGEVYVGQYLDDVCREQKYKVIHDLKGDGFNVDHVVIGSGGIFAIETKTMSKPTIGSPVVTYNGESILVNGMTPDRDPIAQARACASYVARALAESTGRDEKQIFVRPVVLYPGWYIEGSSSGKDVWVLEPKGFAKFLRHERQQLSAEDAALFHSRLKMLNRQTTCPKPAISF